LSASLYQKHGLSHLHWMDCNLEREKLIGLRLVPWIWSMFEINIRICHLLSSYFQFLIELSSEGNSSKVPTAPTGRCDTLRFAFIRPVHRNTQNLNLKSIHE
jgi:hypothetical protein